MPAAVDLAREIARTLVEERRRENLALRLYRPRDVQTPFHRSLASERIIRGGNQSGKTIAAATEVASAAAGIPLTGRDGKPMPFKYPTDRPLVIWVIGYDERHISTIYQMLFSGGLFKIIKDRRTKRWRAWNPNDPDDAARERETKPSPPLIPGGPDCHSTGMIAEWAWHSKVERIFTICRLKNGAEIRAYSSKADPAQGVTVDLIWIDEDIAIATHVGEWQSRLSVVRGRLIWSVWPHGQNEALRLMTRRAEEQSRREHRDVEEWVLSQHANEYLPEDERRKRQEGYKAAGEAVWRARDLGEYVDDLQLVYPSFNVETHGMPRKAGRDPIEQLLAANQWRVPDDWTRYFSVDPGHTNAAVLFLAVPPPWVGRYALLYDEILAQRCEPQIIAELIKAKTAPGCVYRAFLIDWRAGRQTESGSGKRTVDFWVDAFRAKGIRSQLTEHGFLAGSDDIGARNMVVRNWLMTREDGTTQLRLLSAAVPHTCQEFGLYKKRVTRDDVSEEVKRKDNHEMDALGYLAAYLEPLFESNMAYVAPTHQEGRDTVVDAYNALKKKMRGFGSDGAFYCGAGAVPTAD